ncbi:YSIRK-type signal peptide-containing protein, partial [Streptococcus sp. UMB1203]|uniref:mucin-binding protein n=1 Tax=Streptococcus sp. UMB1203 TaxID=3046327 RepID=UPI002555DB25
MYKSKRQKNKSFDWYGLSQRFSIRKYHFGAASVLLGTALILGAAQSTANAEEATADNKTEAVTSTPKDGEGATSPTNVTLPATEARTGAPVLDKKELSEEEIAKLVAEASKKDDKTSETATTEKSEVTDKEKATQAADSTDKKSEKAVDDKADKKDEKKAENPIAATKTILEQLTSEAEVLNTTAANYAEKKVEDKSSKEAIAAAVAAAKVEIAASKKVLNQKDVTAEQLNLQLQRISSAIEAVYTEMKRAGHIGKVEAVLDEANTANAGGRDSAPLELTPVTNTESLTDSEIAAIIKQIRTSNPGLTNEDTITVNKTRGVQGAGFTTITYADGSGSVTFEPGQVMVASAGIKNLEQLSSSINWFNFASATITYKDGTVATPVRYYGNTTTTPNGKLYKQLDANTGSTGRTFEGYFSMYRDITLGRDYTVDGVLYAKGAKLKSTDDAFLKMGIAKYEQHIYYGGNLQGQTDVKVPNTANLTTYTTKTLGEIYEVLQVGMKFDVPTRVEGYRLSATVSKLAPKEVETDPQKGQGNRLRNYTSGTNGNSKAYGPTSVYDIVDGPNGGGRGVDVLLTTQDKTNSYLRSAGIHTNYRERREGDSDTNPTGPVREGLVAFSSSRDHANFGVSLYLEATYNGQLVPVNAVVADADESGRREYSQFETDGGAFEKLMEIHWDNRRLDSKGDAIVDGNGTSVLVDKHGNPYVDAAGNPMFINNKQTPTREDVEDNGITEAKYYLTTASGAKVLVSEKDHMPVLDADGNPTILDSTGTRMTTTREGLFTSTETERNGVKIKTREILDGEGRPILQGSAAMKGLEAFILPSGVKTFEVEYINGNKGKRKYYDTTDGKHKEITKDFYGRSIMYGSEVDGRLAKEGDDPRATLKFKNPDKRPVQLTNAGDLGDMKDAGYDPTQWVSPSAYGSKTFGSFWDAREDGYRLPIGLTQGVSNLSFYGNSTSSVSGVVGFIVTDGGDAPSSYGSAKHVIGNFNKVINNREVTATQPYLGDQPGDPDFRSTVNAKSGDWVLDDLVMTNKYVEKDLGAGETDPSKQVQVTNQKGETGTFLITSSGNAVIRKEDGTQVAVNQGDVLTTPDPATGLPMIGIYNATTKKLGVGAIPDEGEAQLLDPDAVDNTGKKIKGEYTLRQASDTEYVLYGVKANPGVNNKEAYLRGWVDFNGNGKFDVDEASELIKVTPGQKTYDVKFKNVAQLLDTAIDKAGVRLRIALEEQDIRESTGLAGSGEVEDFQTFVTHFPRGTRHETKDYQGQEQGIKFPTNSMFIANGKSKDSGYKNWAQINNVELSPKIVLTDKVVDTTKVTTLDPNAEKDKTDLGTKGIVSRLRKKSDGSIYMQDGKVFVDKNDSTVLTGRLVEVKDKNNKVLGTALEVVNPNNKKTEYLMSEYTEYDSVGNKVGTYKVNPATAGDNKEITGGFYETAVTFKPELGFVGKAKGIAIRAWDDNNNSTGWEANNDTIEASKASTTLAEKDKVLENTNNGNNGYKTMDTSYIPTVIDVRPIGEDTTTTDVQGKKQSARPQIPVYGTVETETGYKITDSRYANEFEIIDKNKSIKLADTLESNKSSYDKDTEVSKATTLTLADGKVVTYTPDKDKLPARAKIAEDADVVVTGTGSVVVNNVRLVTGKTIPAGSSPVDPHPVTADTVVTLANGTETTIPARGRIPTGAKLKNSLVSTANNTWNNVTYNTGDTIPRESGGKISTLAKETSISQIVGKGDVVKVDGKYRATNTIPAGTKVKRILPLNQVVLPSATHLDPTTGAITEVPRSYDLANTNDSKVTITGEGVYELVKDASGKPTGEVTFTPEPGFVGRGTGVDLVQPDIDYNDVVANDKVTEKYGTDYGRAKYTPIVTPVTEASITRTIHYVYESDNDATATSQASYKNNNPILSINNEPVTRSQTLNYTRTYKMFDEDGVLDQPMVTANTVRDVNGTEYTAGTEIPKGTKFSQGTLIISDWKHGENNEEMNSIVSPTVKGYTANVVTLEYNAPNATGEMAHIKDAKEIGTYKPIDRNTKDVGTYKPASSAIRSDDKDNFDMYVVYKADTQKAKVTYIDLDATGDARILEVQTAATAPTTGADAKTTYGVTTLQGKSHTKIPYLTADTIKKYKDLGYELVTDDYTNNTQGTAIEGGRKFDDDKDVDQAFNVYLRHKKVLRQIKDTQEVTRTIEYKYASTDDVPADKRGTTAAPTVTETLHFERDRTIDYTLAAKEYPTEYATYKAVLDKSGYDSPEEYKVRTVYYDHITNKAIAADATAAQKAIVTFGPWTPVGGTATGVTLTPAEVAKDDKFNLVNSPEVTGYTPDNATVEATAAIDAEADDYKITVLYTPVAQKAVVKFVEVDPTNTDKVITPGLADPIAVTGKSEAAYPATTATSVTDKIAELVKKGYELVNNGFVSTDKFDKDAAVDQEYVVKFKAKVVDIPSFDPTKPKSDDNPRPIPGKTPIDPNNPDGPKWTEELINAVKVQEEVTRTIKYVYEDGTPVAESDLTSVADKKVKTLKFTRPGKINVATGEITYGDWSANQKFEAVTSPVLEKYTAAVAGVTPTTADVPAKTVAATDKDFEEVVVYKTKLITVDPKAPNYKEPKKGEPINPSDPNGPKWTDELLAKLKNNEEVTRTITYTYSTEASELNQAEKDGNKGGTNVVEPVTTKVNYTRVAKVNPVTGEITYGDWEAKNNDTTLEGNALPAVAGYVATGDVETSVKPVENVKAEDKDITEKVVYKALGKYVPVVPAGFNPPTIQNPQYPNNPTDPTKPGTPTTIPYVPGTTPVGPDGQPLTPKVPGDPKQGYVPPVPTTPTGDTTIVYTKDGSQVAVTKFVDTTGKGLEPSVVDTGDTGKAFTKDAEVTAAINKILARGYEKVANVNTSEKDYPSTDAEKVFDADASTNQEYTVTFKPIVKDIPTDPTTPGYVKPEPGQPVVPGDNNGPKWPDSVKDLKTTESVTRTIKYIYDDGTPVPDAKLGADVPGKKVQTLEFTRTAKVNLVTGEIEYGTWTPKTTADFEAVTTPTIDGYTSALVSNPTTSDVPAKTVIADAADFEEVVVYKIKQITIDPNDPNFDPNKPVDPNNPDGLKYKDLKLAEEVKRTITYTYADDVADTAKRGTEAEPKHETTVSFTRTATVNAVTKEITYSEWTAKDNDTTLEGKATIPVKPGYVATGDVEASKKDVTGVNATDKDIVEKVIYKDLGKFVPVVPEGFTPPTIENPQYPNNPDDPTKPGTPTTTIPYVPGTTPVGPNGKPLTPKDPNDPKQGYNPPVPTNPTEDTTIVYTKDGSQVAVTHFIEVNSETDKTEKGGVAQSIVDTGDAGKAFTKGAEVTATIEALKAKGYTVVENNYPTDGKFDADSKTNQEFKVLVTVKPVTVNPNDPKPTPNKPIDPNNPTGPKWTPELIKELEDGRKEEVKRTINYVYADGKKAADSVQETKEFKRSATINPITGKITFGEWSPANQTFGEVTS